MNLDDSEKPSGWAKRRKAISMDIEIATFELCLEQGIDVTTVEDIANAVGVSRRTIYRYFDSIEDILRASAIRRLKEIVGEVEARPMSESIRDAFVNAMTSGEQCEVPQVRALRSKLAKARPTEWRRVIAPVAAETDALFEVVTAERLIATGQDPKWARLLAGTIVFVIQRINRDLGNTGGASPHQLNEALDILVSELTVRRRDATGTDADLADWGQL